MSKTYLATKQELTTVNNSVVILYGLVEQKYTAAEKTKLENLTDNFKGLFVDSVARGLAVAVPQSGNYVLQQDTNTVWYYNGTTWVDTGVASSGDMLKAVYDPTNKQVDAFSMGNMVETSGKKILTAVERTKLGQYRGHVANSTEMILLIAPTEGHFCTRADTGSIWIYNNFAWANTLSASSTFGDTKFNYQTTDHGGWYVLNGRSVSTLSATAQAASISLGWGSFIPDTQGKFPLAASSSIITGTNGGSNTIARANLPNFTLSGNTGNESASHTHTTAAYTISETTDSEYATSSLRPSTFAFASTSTVFRDNGSTLAGTDQSYAALNAPDRDIDGINTLHSHTMTINVPSRTSGANNSNHTHAYTTSSINGGVTQTTFMPSFSAKTEFVYLGL
jgi:hypothetical protein